MSSGSALKKPASPLLAFFLLQVAATAASSIARSSCPGAVTAFHPSLHHEQPRFRLGLIKQQHQWRRPASSSFSSSTQQQLVGTPTATTAVDNDTKQQQPQSLAFVERIMAPRGGASNGNGNGNGKGKDASLWNLPNILTLMRVFAIPVLVAIFYQDVAWRNLACTVLFVFAAMTDWLDGYLARRLNLSSPLGAFLDPVADKLMVATALVLMADRMRSPVVTISTAIIINREIGVSALREWMASMNQRDTVAVGWWGKVKTAMQMVALSILLYVQPPFPTTLDPVVGKRLLDTGVGLLAFSALLTVTSAYGYMKAAWPVLTGTGAKPKK